MSKARVGGNNFQLVGDMDINFPYREFRQGLIKYHSRMISASKNSERGEVEPHF